MSKISLVSHSMKICSICLAEIVKGCHENCSEICVNNSAGINCYKVIEATPFVHSKGKRAILELITEGELHLISIFRLGWTSLNSKKFIALLFWSTNCFLNKSSDLFLLDFKLCLVWKRLIHASSAKSEMFTGFSSLKIRFLNYFKKSSLIFSFSCLINTKGYPLARNSILNYYLLSFISKYNSLVWELNIFNTALANKSFFHLISVLEFLLYYRKKGLLIK